MAKGKTTAHLAIIQGSVGSAVYRMAGQGVHVSQKGVTRHGTTGGSSLRAELLASDMHTWSALPSTSRVKWELAAVENLTTARKYWLQWRSWLRATATYGTWRQIAYGYTGNLLAACVCIPVYHRMVMFAQDGTPRIRFTDDGMSWVGCTGTTQGAWSDACFCLSFGNVIAIAYGGSVRAGYSWDGVDWIQTTVPESNQWLACAYSYELRIAVAVAANGTNRTMWTGNGAAWTLGTGGADNAWSGVAWSDTLSIFVAVATTGAERCMYSSDGKAWTLSLMPVLNAWRCVCWCSWLGRFYALSQSATYSAAWTDDGIIWHAVTGPGNLNWYSIRSIPELEIMVATALNGAHGVWITTDGETWTEQSIETTGNPRALCWSPWFGSIFVGTYSTPGQIVQSPITIQPTWDDGTPRIADHMERLPQDIGLRPVSAMTCPSVAWFLISEVTVGEEQRLTFTPSSQLQTGAGIAWLEVFVGTPLKGARNYYKGEYKPMGLTPMGSAPYAPDYFVYPFAESLSGGSRIPVKMRVLARGGRVSPWVEGIATITE